MLSFQEFLGEEIITKVKSTGERRKRKRCKPGFKLSGNKCVLVSGLDKVNKKRAARKAAKTKRSKGTGYQTVVNRKAKKAKNKRKSMGL